MRSLFNFDIATGNTSTTKNPQHSTKGPSNVYNITNKPVTFGGAQCYVLDSAQCTPEQWKTVVNGTALVRNWIVVDANTTSLFPDLANNSTNHTQPSGTGSPKPTATSTSTGGSAHPSSGAAPGRTVKGGWGFAGVELQGFGSVILASLLGTLAVIL